MIARSFSLPVLLAHLSSTPLSSPSRAGNIYPGKPAEVPKRRGNFVSFISGAQHELYNDTCALHLALAKQTGMAETK